MDALENLKLAKELLADKSRWTQGASARDGDGVEVFPNDPAACQFCIYGAMSRVCNGEYPPNALNVVAKVSFDLFDDWHPNRVNDTLGFKAVHKILDTAIERLK